MIRAWTAWPPVLPGLDRPYDCSQEPELTFPGGSCCTPDRLATGSLGLANTSTWASKDHEGKQKPWLRWTV